MEFFKRLLLRDSFGTTSSHSDASRQQVGATAYAVAAFRAAESAAPSPLVTDAVAKAVFALRGPAPLLWRITTAALSWRSVLRRIFCFRRWTKFDVLIDMMACRTRHLDEQLTAAGAPLQAVIIGAGLDARSIRLHQHGRYWFEVDFAAMHNAKWELFASAGFAQPENLECVSADLTERGAWQRALLAARGFDRSVPTLWLLEGLTSYLEQDELHHLLEQITDLSAAGSVVLATFIAATRPEGSAASPLAMHKFFTDAPEALFDAFAMNGMVETSTIGQLASRYDRPSINSNDSGYRFVRAVKGK